VATDRQLADLSGEGFWSLELRSVAPGGVVAETQPPRDLTAPLGVRGIKRSLLEVAGQGLTGSVCIRFVPQADDVPRSVLFRQQVPRLLSASSRALGSAARLATR